MTPPTPAPAPARAATAARAAGWLALLAAGHLGLAAAGRTLPTPPMPWPPAALLDWVRGRDVVVAVFGLLRLLALVSVWYLAAVTVLVLVAEVSGARPLATLARRLALPWARALVARALGAGLAVTLAGGVVPLTAAGAATRSPAATAPAPGRPGVGDPGAGEPVTMTLLDGDGQPVTMRLLPDERPATRAGQAAPISRGLARATVSMHLLDEGGADTTWTIAPGDHLWHVASETLAARWGRPPSDEEIVPYWRALVERNRDRLAAPGDADLVYPGQVFELPPVPPPP